MGAELPETPGAPGVSVASGASGASVVSDQVTPSMSAILINAVPSVAMPLNRPVNTGPDRHPANRSSPRRLIAVDTRLPLLPNLKAATDSVCFVMPGTALHEPDSISQQ